MTARACPHGWIAKSCETCAADVEIAELRALVINTQDIAQRQTLAHRNLIGEARVLRSLLAEARAALETIHVDAQEDGGEALRQLLGQIDTALDPTSREAQQMSITEALKDEP